MNNNFRLNMIFDECFILVILEDDYDYLYQLTQNNLLVPHQINIPCKLLSSDIDNYYQFTG